jgi:hypothetical protein
MENLILAHMLHIKLFVLPFIGKFMWKHAKLLRATLTIINENNNYKYKCKAQRKHFI